MNTISGCCLLDWYLIDLYLRGIRNFVELEGVNLNSSNGHLALKLANQLVGNLISFSFQAIILAVTEQELSKAELIESPEKQSKRTRIYHRPSVRRDNEIRLASW